MGCVLMPGTEETITTGGTGTEEGIPGGSEENLYGDGPYGGGRYGSDDLYGFEETILAQ